MVLSSRSACLSALTAATLLLGTSAVLPRPAAAQTTVTAMPKMQEIQVTTAVSSSPAFAVDWTMSATPKQTSDKLMEMVQGHTEARRTKSGGASPATLFDVRGETRVVGDYYGNHLPKPDVVTTVFTSGTSVAYNATQDAYIRETAKNPDRVPYSISPWMDNSGSVIDFAQGKIRISGDGKPQDDTLDGVPVRVYVEDTGVVSVKSATGVVIQTFHSLTKYYFARDSGQPIRRSSFFSKDNSPMLEQSRLDIKSCKPLDSLADDRFALAIPATAKAWKAPELPPMLAAGTPAPDFSCIGSDGKMRKLSDLKGKIVILDFWATWCGPCQLSFPHLQSVYDATKGRGDVVILALCVRDERALYEKWRVAHKADYAFPVAFDPAGMDKDKSIPYKAYNVGGIPTQYVIDKDGKIAGSLIGYGGDRDHRLETELAKVGIVLPTETKTASR